MRSTGPGHPPDTNAGGGQAAPDSSAHLGIPDLRLLPTSSLVLHEHADPKRVARLASRVQSDGYMKNPPIVAQVPGSDRYVVLDGANRTSAIQGIGCPHMLVQVVDYLNQVELYTWFHLISGRAPDTFLNEIARIEGLDLQPTNLSAAREALAERQVLAYIVLPTADAAGGSSVFTARSTRPGEPATGHGPTDLLNAMVDTYKGDPQVSIHRVSSDDLPDLMRYYDNVSGLVVFPSFTREDILRLAETGARVPSGITRHIISHRALRVNVLLSLMCGGQSLEEKNAWWLDQLKRKLASNEIRLYQESTYLFDE